MAKLTIEELINKKNDCLKRLNVKYINIGSKFLGGEIEFHSLDKGNVLDFRERMKVDSNKAVLYFIYMSSDDLRDEELLKAYGCDKKERYKIVEKLFATEAEQGKILEILFKLNGLDGLNPDEIYAKELDDIKN